MRIFVRLFFVLIAVATVVLPTGAFAADQSAFCVELADKAEDFIHEKGKDYALKVFSASKGPFINNDVYVFACSMDGIMLAHPYKKELLGQNVSAVTDTKGKQVFREFQKLAQEKGSGWIDYWWAKPGEQREFSKSTFIKRIPNYDLYIGVGYYRPIQYSQEAN